VNCLQSTLDRNSCQTRHSSSLVRKRGTAIRLLFGLAPLFMGIASEAGPRQLSAADEAALASGQVIVDVAPDPQGAAGQVDAVIDIPASAGQLWKVMLDCDRAPRFLAGLQSCTVLKESADKKWDIREHRVQWSSLFPVVRSVFRSDYEPMHEIRFSRVEGDLELLEGSWRLEPLKGKAVTRLYYHARVDPGIRLPNIIVRSVIENDMPKTLKALRKEVIGDSRP
jgi:ribosome-associated toxin RatA of RatAB toxin-antitoxin module